MGADEKQEILSKLQIPKVGPNHLKGKQLFVSTITDFHSSKNDGMDVCKILKNVIALLSKQSKFFLQIMFYFCLEIITFVVIGLCVVFLIFQ